MAYDLAAEIDFQRRRVRIVAPMIPMWLENLIGSLMADPRANSDALLLLADALEQASVTATSFDQRTIARELKRLADLPRNLAPSRAGVA